MLVTRPLRPESCISLVRDSDSANPRVPVCVCVCVCVCVFVCVCVCKHIYTYETKVTCGRWLCMVVMVHDLIRGRMGVLLVRALGVWRVHDYVLLQL